MRRVFSPKRGIVTVTFLCILTVVGCSASQPPAAERQPITTQLTQSPESPVQVAEPIKSASPQRQVSQQEKVPDRRMLDVPLIKQNPELKYGCEITSLTMLLRYAGYDVDKMTLASQVSKDEEPLVQQKGDIRQWGDPNQGFVGDMTGKRKGFAVYHKPLEKLLRHYMGERTVNLTGQSFDRVLQSVRKGRPVVVWTTGDFRLPTEWESWYKDGKKIVAPFDEHAVLIVGYDPTYVYVNDPLRGGKNQPVERGAMIKSWEALGKQALTYR
ncbi:C39 family peptidase [Brevibacillus humidisoli]|uniref:C39 family peptidase n=1 Tax=Brevibacillus humidisoli TaxID=2895522 RepID=UPI001E306884|nr:C39 family peptidase [Brevibacillus humidisoli]UFJ42010.1 C39 family peptidase [Brevibacillus humidisoli]